MAAGVLPALATTGCTIQASLQNAAARGSSVRFGIGTSVLMVAEIVLSVGILAAGTARARSVLVHQGVALGFDPGRYIVGTLTVPEGDPMERPSAADTTACSRWATFRSRWPWSRPWRGASA